MILQSALTNAAQSCKEPFAMLMHIAENAQAQISCMGRRYIFVKGYKGDVTIDFLTDLLIQLIKQKEFEYTQEERRFGEILSTRIIKLYRNSDEIVEECNCIKRFLVNIWDFWASYTHKTRYKWMVCGVDSISGCGSESYCFIFRYYTARQYLAQFNSDPRSQSVTRKFRFYDPKVSAILWHEPGRAAL